MDGAVQRPAGGRDEDPAERLTLMRRVAVLMLLVGALTCALGAVVKDLSPLASAAQSGCAAGFALCGLGLLVTRPRQRVLEGATLASIAFLGAMMGTSNEIGMTPFFYLWPVVLLAYFGSPRLLQVSLGWMALTLGVALALNATELPKVDTFTGTLASVGIMATLVAMMQRRDRRLRERLALAANTDPLTGLLNRRAFSPQLDELFARAVADGTDLSVVLFDLDHFKQFNDIHGHLVGDQALQRFAGVLLGHAGPDDLVSRFGGEEFLAALPGAELAAARAYAERVLEALCADATEPHLRLSSSAGISTLRPGHTSVHALLTHADDALYEAKAAGRARAAWWDERPQVVEIVARGRVQPAA